MIFKQITIFFLSILLISCVSKNSKNNIYIKLDSQSQYEANQLINYYSKNYSDINITNVFYILNEFDKHLLNNYKRGWINLALSEENFVKKFENNNFSSNELNIANNFIYDTMYLLIKIKTHPQLYQYNFHILKDEWKKYYFE